MRQLALSLETDSVDDASLRRAWLKSRLDMPFEVAIRSPAIAICLRHIAEMDTRPYRRHVQRRPRNTTGFRYLIV